MQDLILSAPAADTPPPDAVLHVVLPVVGVVCAGLALLLMVKRKEWRRTQAVLMFIAGLALAGLGGLIRDYLESWLAHASSAVSGIIFGAAVSWLVAFLLTFWFGLDMDIDGLINKMRGKKNAVNKHRANAFTPWLALIVPGLLTTLPFVLDFPRIFGVVVV